MSQSRTDLFWAPPEIEHLGSECQRQWQLWHPIHSDAARTNEAPLWGAEPGKETKMTVRNLCVAALLPWALSAMPANGQVSDNVVRIGVLTDLTGPYSASTGQGSVTAARMAAEDVGGKVLGKPVEILAGDHQ